MYCRDLTSRFSDVWVVSGPLALPSEEEEQEEGEGGRKTVSYQVQHINLVVVLCPFVCPLVSLLNGKIFLPSAR